MCSTLVFGAESIYAKEYFLSLAVHPFLSLVAIILQNIKVWGLRTEQDSQIETSSDHPSA